jgi:hypothetical protein
LHVAQQNLLRLACHFQVEDRRVECFFLQCVKQRVVIEFDQLRFAGAVHDTRGLARVTQAAARTRTLQITLESDDFHLILHYLPATRQQDGPASVKPD